jgi:hypothetical protein
VNWQQNESFLQMAAMHAPPWLSSVHVGPSASPVVQALWSQLPASALPAPLSVLLTPPSATVLPLLLPPLLEPELLLVDPELLPPPVGVPPPKQYGGGAATAGLAGGGFDVHVVVEPPGSANVPLKDAVGDSTSKSVQVLFHW